MVKKNISHIKDCYGCGVCASICPKKIIKLDLNKDGFYEPIIFDEEACILCELCLSVCAYNDDQLSVENTKDLKGYAAWSNDEQVRRECTSGGLAFEIGKKLLGQGYKACGVKYDPELNRAEHFMASTIEEFIPSIKSKYLQSYSLTGFSQFNKKDKFFVTGTPCQIDSLRRYIKKLKIEENYVLLDFYCHGVPSMNMWKKYCLSVEKKNGKIRHVSWRNKRTRWNKFSIQNNNTVKGNVIPWMDSKIVMMNGSESGDYVSHMNTGDMFFLFFLGDICLNKACYNSCKYKQTKSAADIRVGDFWGKKYLSDVKGVSGLLSLTDIGENVVSSLENCTFKREEVSEIGEGQHQVPPRETIFRKYFIKAFASDMSIERIYSLFQAYRFPSRLKNKVLRVLHLR